MLINFKFTQVVSTWRTLEKTFATHDHQDQERGTARHPPEPHWLLLFSLLVEESYGALALGDSFSLIDVGNVWLPTYFFFSFLSWPQHFYLYHQLGASSVVTIFYCLTAIRSTLSLFLRLTLTKGQVVLGAYYRGSGCSSDRL